MMLKENKLKYLIRQIIREMAFNPKLSNQGGDWSSYDMTDLKTKKLKSDLRYHPGTGEQLSTEELIQARNVAPQTHNPNNLQPDYNTSRFATQLGWRLSAYPDVKVKFISAPSNFNTYLSVDRGALNNFRDRYDSGVTRRHIDITGRANEFIKAISTEVNVESSPQLKVFFQELLQLDKLVAGDSGLAGLVYFGGHPRSPVPIADDEMFSHDNPTAFNLLHQIVDGQYFVEQKIEQLIEIFFKNFSKNGKKLFQNYDLNKGFFEGRNFLADTDTREAFYNLVVMAIGWLNPDTGVIMKDNKTNQGLAGSNEHYDIVKRCLSVRLKEDVELIEILANAGFAELLRQAVAEFWQEIRGKLIVIFSYGI